jgi:hypothetical protein
MIYTKKDVLEKIKYFVDDGVFNLNMTLEQLIEVESLLTQNDMLRTKQRKYYNEVKCVS